MQAMDANFGGVSFDRGRDSRQALFWMLPWGVALAFGAGMAEWAPHARTAALPDFFGARTAALSTAAVADKPSHPFGALTDFRLSPASPSRDAVSQASLQAALQGIASRSATQLASALSGQPSSPFGSLVDPGFFKTSIVQASLEAAPAAPVPAAPLPPKREVAAIEEAAPLPPARPAALAATPAPALAERRAAPSDKSAGPATASAGDDRNIFEKLFGVGHSASPATAYAEPEPRAAGGARVASLAATDRSSGFSFFAKSGPPPGYDKYTAVYDISARTVYLPDGTKLEAHSGLGDRLDDPRHVNERMRGATPPHLYELTMREDLFHGVQALRLTPVGDGDVFGRAGLLAHPFMLGPNGDSNGCVSFRDYDAFLKAYQQGQVKRLAVVAKLD